MEILIITLLMFKHFIADFILQMDYMVQQKGSYGERGGLDHASIHAFFTAVIVWIFVPYIGAVIMIGLIDGILHYHIDWAKMNLSRGLTPANKQFWVWLGADQLLHFLTYAGLTIWIFAFYGHLIQ